LTPRRKKPRLRVVDHHSDTTHAITLLTVTARPKGFSLTP
jgi:hypothetical protein